MEHAELLIEHYLENWKDYLSTARDLIALKRFDEAQIKVKEGLEKFPNQINLKKYLTYIKSFHGMRVKKISELEKDKINLGFMDVISYSSDPNFFNIVQSKRTEYVEEYQTEKQ